MAKVMISQPMGEKSVEEIRETRAKAVAELETAGYEVIDTWFTDAWYDEERAEERGVVQRPLYFLRQISGGHELLLCSLFLQGVGAGQRLPDRARGGGGLRADHPVRGVSARPPGRAGGPCGWPPAESRRRKSRPAESRAANGHGSFRAGTEISEMVYASFFTISG